MESITSKGTLTFISTAMQMRAAYMPIRMAPPTWVVHSAGTSTRGVQGTPMVGDMARTMAFSICSGVPPSSATVAAATQAEPAPKPSMLQPVVTLPTRNNPPIFSINAAISAMVLASTPVSIMARI